LGGWLLAVALTGRAVSAPSSEYDLKAAYLFNILRFVEHRDVPKGEEHFTLGLHAAGAIEQAIAPLEGSLMHGKKLRIRTIKVESELVGCDAVFFGSSTARTNRILSKATALGLLTVGNDADFIPNGGMMALVVESRRIVLAVNSSLSANTRWAISSHLMEVARITDGARE
jgi:YfiR/HmsC-like